FRGIAQPVAMVVEVELRAVLAGRAGLVMPRHRARRYDDAVAGTAGPLAEVALLPVGREEALVEAAQRLPDWPRERHGRAVDRPDIGNLVVLPGVALAVATMGAEHDRRL